MGTFEMTGGHKIEKSKIDRLIPIAKDKYLDKFLDIHGYQFCERCKGNQHSCPGIARSHIISTDQCQQTGRAELSYDKRVFELLGNNCHGGKNGIEHWSHKKREMWFWCRSAGISFDDFIYHFERDEIELGMIDIFIDGLGLSVENYSPNLTLNLND